jgi:hypothetical protein
MDPDNIPERIISNGLQECKDSLAVTVKKLERHMKDLIDRVVTKSRTATNSEEELADIERLQEELDSARKCMDICFKADTHLKENVSTIDNYATGDAIQFMVSTDGKTIHGRNRGLGWRTRQVGGHLSDVTVQNISRDFATIRFKGVGSESPASPDDATSIPDNQPEHKYGSEFKERYGRGRTTADMPPASSGSTEGKPSSSAKV